MSRGCLLVVDDEADIREIATLSLQTVGGWDVRQAASGREALEVAASERFDAILLDVMMPELDGPSTYAAMRQTGAVDDVPVIFLTAKVQPADKRMLESTGAAGIIAKPFDPMKLPDQVGRMLASEER